MKYSLVAVGFAAGVIALCWTFPIYLAQKAVSEEVFLNQRFMNTCDEGIGMCYTITHPFPWQGAFMAGSYACQLPGGKLYRCTGAIVPKGISSGTNAM
jgi:hypothetical protein